MEQDQTEYQSYLLRLWRENPDGDWRALLQDVLTSERYSFANLESLFAFLVRTGGRQTEMKDRDGGNP